MLQALGDLLPSALGVALSPFPIIAVVLILGTPKARLNGPAFALGWAIGLTGVAALVVAVAGAAADSGDSGATAVDVVKLLVGVLLLALAAKKWRGQPRAGEVEEPPAWMAAVGEFSTAKSFGFGIALSAANPKNLGLTAAAASSLAQANLSGGATAVDIAIYVALASVTVAGAVLYFLVAPQRATPALASVREFMEANSAVIMVVVLLVLGGKVTGDAIAALTG